jgi:DNA polymerase (family 10)
MKRTNVTIEPANTDLVRPCDIRGLLHAHTRNVDGCHSMRRMVETAIALGLEYLGISDHFRSAIHPEGLDAEGEDIQREEIDNLRRQFPGFELLHGVELNADADGMLPLDDDLLATFDYVLVSLTEPNGSGINEYTRMALRVIDNPWVSVVSKPLGDYMLRPAPLPLNMDVVLKAAAAGGTIVELDANPRSLDLCHHHCALACDYGVKLAINTDAHRAARLGDFRHGVEIARDAGIPCHCLVNTFSADDLRRHITTKRARMSGDHHGWQ